MNDAPLEVFLIEGPLELRIARASRLEILDAFTRLAALVRVAAQEMEQPDDDDTPRSLR